VGALPCGRGPFRIRQPCGKVSGQGKGACQAWFEEAKKNLVLPLDDRSPPELLGVERPSEEKPRERYIYYPGTSPVPEGVAFNMRGRSYKILADVEIKDANCSGVIFAHGSRFGGHSLFIKDKKLHYVYNFLGIKPEQKLVSSELNPGKYTLGMAFIRETAGKYGESLGKTTLYVNEKVVAEGDWKTQIRKFTLSERVHPLDVPFTQAIKSVSRSGSGSKDLGRHKTERISNAI
jgi:arylsulfatase